MLSWDKNHATCSSDGGMISSKLVDTIPDDITILSKLPAILKNHPGDIAITIGEVEKKVSEEVL